MSNDIKYKIINEYKILIFTLNIVNIFTKLKYLYLNT